MPFWAFLKFLNAEWLTDTPIDFQVTGYGSPNCGHSIDVAERRSAALA
jgi:hypothetical protein